jgi:hypothetical protein
MSNGDSNELLRSRDAVLSFVKATLQPFFDAGSITRVQYVDIAKSVLYRTMNSEYGSDAWTTASLTQQVALRIAEVSRPVSSAEQAHAAAARSAAISAPAPPLPPPHQQQQHQTPAATPIPAQRGAASASSFSPYDDLHRTSTSPPRRGAAIPTSTAATTAVANGNGNVGATLLLFFSLLESVERTARAALLESEEAQRQALAMTKHSGAKQLQLLSTVLSLVHQLHVQQQQQRAAVATESAVVGGTQAVPVALLQEQQIALRQLLHQQQQQQRTMSPGVAARVPTPTRNGSAVRSSGGGSGRGITPTRRGGVGTPAQQQQQQQPSKAAVVEFMRAVLQPAYDAGVLPTEKFAEVVREVSVALFREGAHLTVPWKRFVRQRIAHLLVVQQ